MNKLSKNGSAWAFTAISLAACVYAFYIHAVWTLYTNTDAGWLIQTGQYILNHGLPKTNMYSWTIPHSPIVVYQWLFEVVAALLFRFGSVWLVGFAACVVIGTLILFVLPRIWMNKGLPAFLPFAVLALVQTPNWFHARPQLFSYGLTLAFVCLLEGYRSTGKTKYLLLLPPLMVLWANTHLLWTFGLFTIFVYLGCDAWRRKSLPVALSTTLFSGAASVLLNPYGFGLLAYVASFFTGSQWGEVWEMLPAYRTAEGGLYFLAVVAACVVLALARRKMPPEALILSGVVATAALFAHRFQPLAIITMWTYLGDAIVAMEWSRPMPNLSPETNAAISSRWFRIAQATTVIGIATAVWFWQAPTLWAAWMLYTENAFPLLAAYQKVCTPEDHLFNEDTMGSWLIGMQAGPVFFDTRLDNYPRSFLEAAINCLKAKGNWSEFLERWQITQVLVRDVTTLNQEFMYRPEWTLVLHDGRFAWWTRTSELSTATLRHWSLSDDLIQDSKLPPWIVKSTVESRAAKYLLLARIDREHHKPHQAIQEAELGLKLLPQSSALQKELALCGQSL